MAALNQSTILKKELDALRPLKKEDEMRIMQKFRLDWNYHSNNLEGNTLTYGETKALILFGITAQGKPLKDHFEITGHDEAVKWIMDIVKEDRPLSENFIRELHKLILKEPYEVDAITPDGRPTKKMIKIGVYKSTPNHVKTKTGEIFRFATPEETPAKMSDLINSFREKQTNQEVNPILLAAEFHYQFIRIHPFDDGNGRTARILMNFILMQKGYPPVIIKTQDKENYFAVLRQADAGLFEPFVNYIAENLNRSLEIMIKGARGESIEEPDDIDKEIALLEKKLNSVGEILNTTKSRNVILQILDKSIIPVINRFREKSKKLDEFYVSIDFKIWVDSSSSGNTTSDTYLSERRRISDSTRKVKIEFFYNSFKNSKIYEFDYTSTIEFQFQQTRYAVISSNTLLLEKFYTEQLDEDEIQAIVNSEIKRHLLFINQKLEDSSKWHYRCLLKIIPNRVYNIVWNNPCRPYQSLCLVGSRITW